MLTSFLAATGDSSRVKVVHRHGPCSPLSRQKDTNHARILRRDWSRVKSSSADTTIPVRGCSLFSASEYVVTVGVGSPSQDLTLALDTAADLTWVQCKPCAVYCYLQKDLLFDPSKIDDVLQRFLLLPGMISLVTCGTRPLSVRTSQSNHSEA